VQTSPPPSTISSVVRVGPTSATEVALQTSRIAEPITNNSSQRNQNPQSAYR
jgi:hypothetical protein